MIYLIGARASGKTTLGRKLAAALKRPFVDTDRRIRLATGKTVAELVEAGGWEAFRQAEADVLGEVAVFSGQVVSCGGGLVLRQENREVLEKGIVLYLQAPAEVLAERAPLYEGLARITLQADAPLERLVELALAEIKRLERR